MSTRKRSWFRPALTGATRNWSGSDTNALHDSDNSSDPDLFVTAESRMMHASPKPSHSRFGEYGKLSESFSISSRESSKKDSLTKQDAPKYLGAAIRRKVELEQQDGSRSSENSEQEKTTAKKKKKPRNHDTVERLSNIADRLVEGKDSSSDSNSVKQVNLPVPAGLRKSTTAPNGLISDMSMTNGRLSGVPQIYQRRIIDDGDLMSESQFSLADMFDDGLSSMRFNRTPQARRNAPSRKIGNFVKMDSAFGDFFDTTPSFRADEAAKKVIIYWTEAVYDFSQYTTFHGIRFIFEKTYYLTRRLMWILVVLACAGVMTYQMSDRVEFFYSWPFNVKVEMKYSYSLEFPSVVICNQNSFRLSKAAELGWFRWIDKLYTYPNITTSGLNASSFFDNITLSQMYQATAHQKEDMIVSCKWEGEQCDSKNFTEIFTDYGLCFEFNSPHHAGIPKLHVKTTGSNQALQLTLNIQQYEYMSGPHNSAGLRILTYNSSGDVPMVEDLGQAVPPGTRTLIGVKLRQLFDLKEPHGKPGCKTKKLKYFKDYSVSACKLECEMDYVLENCRCRTMYMPNVSGVVECTVGQYANCLRKLKKAQIQQCTRNCPRPCFTTVFEPSISYSSVSIINAYAIVRGLEGDGLDRVKNEFLHAKEIATRTDDAQAVTDDKLIENYVNSTTTVWDALVKTKSSIRQSLAALNNLWDQSELLDQTKTELFEFQIYVVEMNFLRAFEAMDERSYSHITPGFKELYDKYLRTTEELGTQSDSSSRANQVRLQTKYEILHDTLTDLYSRSGYASGVMEIMIQRYRTGRQIFEYLYKNKTLEENDYIVPRDTMSKVTTHNSDVRMFGSQVAMRLTNLAISYRMAITQLEKVYSQEEPYNETACRRVAGLFQNNSISYNQDLHSARTHIFQWPLKLIKERQQLFRELQSKRNEVFTDLQKELRATNQNTDVAQEDMLRFVSLAEQAEGFLNRNITKLELANAATEDTLPDFIQDLKKNINSIRIASNDLVKYLDKVHNYMHFLWRFMLLDNDMLDYYEYKKYPWHNMNMDQVTASFKKTFKKWTDSLQFRESLQHHDEELSTSFTELKESLQQYKAETTLDKKFIKDNYLHVDIFYREMAYEEILQTEAYPIWALLSDIGGSMGLFVGASVITIFELGDLLFYQIMLGTAKNKK